MKDVLINENRLEDLACATERLIELLSVDAETLREKDADNFERYMAFCRLNSLINTSSAALELVKANLMLGFHVNHESLQTKKACKCNWDEIQLSDNPFFKTKNEKEDDSVIESINLSAVLERMAKKMQSQN